MIKNNKPLDHLWRIKTNTVHEPIELRTCGDEVLADLSPHKDNKDFMKFIYNFTEAHNKIVRRLDDEIRGLHKTKPSEKDCWEYYSVNGLPVDESYEGVKIFKCIEPTSAGPTNYATGYYYSDEAQLLTGPYENIEVCVKRMQVYFANLG